MTTCCVMICARSTHNFPKEYSFRLQSQPTDLMISGPSTDPLNLPMPRTDHAPAAWHQDMPPELDQIVAGLPLSTLLEQIIDRFEAEFDRRAYGCVLLLDRKGQRLLAGAARRLPAAYLEQLHGLEIGAAAGSCGTAAYTRKQVYSTHI